MVTRTVIRNVSSRIRRAWWWGFATRQLGATLATQLQLVPGVHGEHTDRDGDHDDAEHAAERTFVVDGASLTASEKFGELMSRWRVAGPPRFPVAAWSIPAIRTPSPWQGLQ